MAKNVSRNLYRVQVVFNGETDHAETQQRWESVTLAKNIKKAEPGAEIEIQRFDDKVGWVFDKQGTDELGPKAAPTPKSSMKILVKTQAVHTAAADLKKVSRTGMSKDAIIPFFQQVLDLTLATGVTTDDVRNMLDYIDATEEN